MAEAPYERVPEAIAKIVDSKLAQRVYEDALCEPVKEAGALASDILQGLRLFTRPFGLAATYQKRLFSYLENCRSRVPEDRQVESPAEIAGPIIERLRFLEGGNPLTEMYLNLLTTSIDKERQKQIHPAFAIVLNQLSRDEVVILDQFRQPHGYGLYLLEDGDAREVRISPLPKQHDVAPKEAPLKLAHHESLNFHLGHLQTLDLLAPVRPSSTPWFRLTRFGELFLEACSAPSPRTGATGPMRE